MRLGSGASGEPLFPIFALFDVSVFNFQTLIFRATGKFSGSGNFSCYHHRPHDGNRSYYGNGWESALRFLEASITRGDE
jgi:hypothetical protein